MSGKVTRTIRIGGASGYWGDNHRATPQLLSCENLDFIVYDYLAEITMSILARARAKNPDMGYAPDFISDALAPNLANIARKGVRIISNAGGVNAIACARAIEEVVNKAGLDLKVACITGDDLLGRAEELKDRNIREMFDGSDFPDPEKIASINVYTGAFAIARALDMGADIVITGRCVDSAVTLGACIHSFGWQRNQFDLLSSGSLAGHLIECGAQATGGNFTDWELCADTMGTIGYPVVEVAGNGELIVTKVKNSGGIVTTGTVAEQMIYEIGDPQQYILPDVVCDFSNVKLHQIGTDRVAVSGAIGYAPPEKLKTVVTWQDGYRGGHALTFYGVDADKKALHYAKIVLQCCEKLLAEKNLANYSQTSVEVLGTESQFGAQASVAGAREVCVKIAAKHEAQAGISLLLREMTGLALSGPPGLSGFAGTRPRPSPVVALFTCLLERKELILTISLGGKEEEFLEEIPVFFDEDTIVRPTPPRCDAAQSESVGVPLIKLALARSGDKGDKANIGIIARKKEYLPYIWSQLNADTVSDWFAHFLKTANKNSVRRYYLPGSEAVNFVLDNVLDGGGTASLRNDPQAKGYGQLLLGIEIQIPVVMAEGLL